MTDNGKDEVFAELAARDGQASAPAPNLSPALSPSPARPRRVEDAEQLQQRFRAQIEEWALWDSDPMQAFENLAAQFYAETGFLAPGKSEPLEMSSVDRDVERAQRYNEWTKARKQTRMLLMRDLLAALHDQEVAQARLEADLGSWRRVADMREAERLALAGALEDLVALVRGESPSLLDEDSGGDALLSLTIDDLLKPEARLTLLEARWQPIESAPRDGTSVIVLVGDLVGEATCLEGESYSGSDAGWWWANTSPGDYYAEKIALRHGEPTHWMPLPDPPALRGQRRQAQAPRTEAPVNVNVSDIHEGEECDGPLESTDLYVTGRGMDLLVNIPVGSQATFAVVVDSKPVHNGAIGTRQPDPFSDLLRDLRSLEQQWRKDADELDEATNGQWIEPSVVRQCADDLASLLTRLEQR